MSILQSIENAIETTMQDIEALVVKVATGVEVAAEDIAKGVNWLAGQMPAIATGLTEASGLVKQVVAATPGLAQNALVTQAVADIDNAAAATNAFVAAANTGANNAAALTSAYVAYQNSAAATAAAKAVVIGAATAPATTAPTTTAAS